MAATWHDQIRANTGVDVSGDADPCRLWVPMQLQALVFGVEGTASFLDLTPYYDRLLERNFSAPLGYQLRPRFDPALPRTGSSPALDAAGRVHPPPPSCSG